MKSLWLLMLENPVTLVIAGIVALASVIMIAKNTTIDYQKVLDDITKTQTETKATDSLITQYENLQKQIESNTKAGIDNTKSKKDLIAVEEQLAGTFPSTATGL